MINYSCSVHKLTSITYKLTKSRNRDGSLTFLPECVFVTSGVMDGCMLSSAKSSFLGR